MPKDRLPGDDTGASTGDAAAAVQNPPGKQTLVSTALGSLPGAALPKTTVDLQVHPPEYISEAVDRFRRALNAGDANAAQIAWATVPSQDRIKFGKSPTIGLDLQTIMRVLGPMLVPIMGECQLDFVGRTDLIEQILRVGHPNWFDPIADYGGTLLSSFIDYLPTRGTIDEAALAKLQRLITGTTSLALARPLFERIYNTTLSDTSYDVKEFEAAAWSATHIHRLYDVLCQYPPLAHVRTIKAFYLAKDKDHAWWNKDRVVLPENDANKTDNRKHRMTGGSLAQADPETSKGETKGEMDKFDVGALHEVGHGVGGRLGGHAWAETYPWVGWQTKMGVDAWSKALWGDDAALTKRMTEHAGKHATLSSLDARHYLADDLHKAPKLPAGFKAGDDVEEAIDRYYGDQKLTRYWRAQQGQDVQHAYLFSEHANYGNDGRVYVYLSRGSSNFSSYNQQAHAHKISWYSLSSPHEWFAEQYAHYYRTKKAGPGLEAGTRAKLDELDKAKPADEGLMNPAVASAPTRGIAASDARNAAGDDGGGNRRVPFPWWTRALAALAIAACAGSQPDVIASVPAGGGVPALEHRLRDTRAIAGHTATTDDMLALVKQFEAFPPHRNAQGEPDPHNYFHGPHAPAPLRPHLDYQDGGRATFTMNYRDTATGDAGGDSGTMRVFAWTLAIDPIAPLAWTMRVRHWDSTEKRFDVDHD